MPLRCQKGMHLCERAVWKLYEQHNSWMSHHIFLVLTQLTPEQTGVGAGVIAIIVISLVVGAVVCSVSGKKAYEYYQRKREKVSDLQDNPLYVPSDNSMVNPLYTFEEE